MNQSHVSQTDISKMILSNSALGYRGGPRISIVNIALLLTGSWLHLIAEFSLLPQIASFIYFCFGWFSLLFFKIGGKWERFIFTRVFLSGYLSAGVAAIYRTFFADIQGDAIAFFEIASGGAAGLSIIEISVLTEGSIAVVLWREIFDLMSAIGFPREQYVGVLVNVLIVALSSVVAIKIVRQVYGHDPYRFKMLVLAYSVCGLFWLFSGIFIRDSIILFGVNLLVSVWVYFLNKPGVNHRLVVAVFASILASSLFGFIRSEFVFVPIAMVMAAVAAMCFGQSRAFNKYRLYPLLTFGLVVIGVAYVNFGEDLWTALNQGRQGYIDEASSVANDSLGMSLIVKQPLLIRVVLGAVYLYIFPIPLWSGFQLESSYHLFKSLNTIFIIFLLPLMILAFRMLWRDNLSRSLSVMFTLFLVMGFSFAIAATSLETRHLGVFFVPIFIIALLPNMQNSIVRRNYRQILYFVIFVIFLIHFAWLFLKFGFIVVKAFFLIFFMCFVVSASSKITRHIFMVASLLMVGLIVV